MKSKRAGVGFPGASFAVVAAAVLLALPGAIGGELTTGPGASTSYGKLSLSWRWVSVDGACDSSCFNCPTDHPGFSYNASGQKYTACYDVISVGGSRSEFWSATFLYPKAHLALKMYQATGTVYPGQKVDFVFGEAVGPNGSPSGCPPGGPDCPRVVAIAGPVNTVYIGDVFD
ncbi:MAG: hypothetical protein WCA77_07190 [Thermoplasmata archaeon]